MQSILNEVKIIKEKQEKINSKVKGYIPLLKKLLILFYPDLEFNIHFLESYKMNHFAGYHEPKIKIITLNVSPVPIYDSITYSPYYKIKNSINNICSNYLSELIYSYLPDVLYYTSFHIIPNDDEIQKTTSVIWDFESDSLRKEVEKRYEDYSLVGYSLNN